MERDIGAEMMEERLRWAVEIVKNLCKLNNIPFSEAMLIKSCEVGVSLYIQKEQRNSRARSFSAKVDSNKDL